MKACGGILLGMLLATTAAAGTLSVRPDGRGPHPTIQAALDAAADGDTIRLGAGVYTGPGNRDLDFRGRDLRLIGDPQDPAACTLDLGAGPDSVRAFFFHSGETPSALVRGLTVIGGVAPGPQAEGGLGGAVLCVGSSPTLADCVLERSRAHTGGAVALQNSSARLQACVFTGNTAEIGGAVSISGGGPILWGCTFQGNTASRGGAVAGYETKLRIDRTYFNANTASQGGAVALDQDSQGQISGSLLSNNFASFGGGIYVQSSVLSCSRVTLVQNSAGSGGGLHLDGSARARIEATLIVYSIRGGAVELVPGAALDPACSLIFANAGGDWVGPLAGLKGIGGNLDQDPRLADPGRANFVPLPDSPCRTTRCGVIGALD